MKYFKTALTAVLCVIIAAVCPTVSAKADSDAFRYAYVDEGVEAYFCKEPNISASVFAIPETYCVEILKEEGEWYYCRYAKDEGAYSAVRGYCLKNKLKLIAEPLEREYLNLTLKVKFHADKSSSFFPFDIELSLPFYGNSTVNASLLACVYYDGGFYYVADPVTSYEKNPLPQPVVSTDVTEPDNSNKATIITAIIITVIAVVAVAVLYFVGKRPKLPPNP